MQTIQEFIASEGLMAESVPVPVNPDMDSDWAEKANASHFLVTIIGDAGRYLTTYFSVGSGIVDVWLRENGRPLGRDVFLKAPRSVNGAAYREREAPRYRPDLATVLDSLASDAQSIDCTRDFEDWAESLGYDTDSRRAERTYNACVRLCRELESLLGRDKLRTLLEQVERL